MGASQFDTHSQSDVKHVQLPVKGDNQHYTIAYNIVPNLKQPDILNRVSAEQFTPLSNKNAQQDFISESNNVNNRLTTTKFEVLRSNHSDVKRSSELRSPVESTCHDSTVEADGMVLPNSFSIPGPESCV